MGCDSHRLLAALRSVLRESAIWKGFLDFWAAMLAKHQRQSGCFKQKQDSDGAGQVGTATGRMARVRLTRLWGQRPSSPRPSSPGDSGPWVHSPKVSYCPIGDCIFPALGTGP